MITEEMTALVPCPLCGGSEGYSLREGVTYRWWDVCCSSCGDQISECRADRRVALATTSKHANADAAWNSAGDYAEGLRVSVIALREICREAHDRLLRGASERELLATLTVGYGPGPYGGDE